MLGVDERADPPVPLGLGHGVQRQGGLARGLRAEDLHHPAPGKPPDA